MEKMIIPHYPQYELRIANDLDLLLIEEFCNECKKLNYTNNQSLKNIKWDWIKNNGKYFIGLDNKKIFTLAGYHILSDIDQNSWRVLFRGAQLPDYLIGSFNKNPLKVSIHIAHILYYQITDILKQDPLAKIYISTNIYDNTDAPKSARLNRSTAPILEKQGILKLEIKDINLYHTRQNLWRVNINEYMRQRSEIYFGV